MDACQTSTARRKLTEEHMDADPSNQGQGRVTGKSWWTGVEPADRDQWDMSLLIPVRVDVSVICLAATEADKTFRTAW